MAKKKKKVGKIEKPKKRGRRSSEQICIDLKRERARLYSKRARLVKQPKSVLNDRQYNAIGNRLDAIRTNLFKCGKKFARFKQQRTKLRKHQHYLQSRINILREEMAVKGISKKKKGLLKKKLNILGNFKLRTGEKINLIERAMQLPIGNVKSSKGVDKGLTSVKGGKFVVQDIIWVMTDSWSKWLNSGYFETLVLDDELFDISENPMIATAAIYQAYDWAMAWQHVYGTPFFFAFGDAMNGYLEIKVKKYTTEMYADEIAKHKGDITEG